MQAALEGLEQPWVVCFLVQQPDPDLDSLMTRFPDRILTVLAFHDLETGNFYVVPCVCRSVGCLINRQARFSVVMGLSNICHSVDCSVEVRLRKLPPA